MAKQASQSGRAFTLVELLVVIAIIAVLLAILLPVLHRARRAAAVLASPIAYTDKNGQVHLTDPGGGMDVPIGGQNNVSACPVCHGPPQWSPTGQTLALSLANPSNARAPGLIQFVDPVPNRVRTFADDNFFWTWVDNDQVLEGMPGGLIETWSVGVHRMRNWDPLQFGILSLAAAPTGMGAPYVASYHRRGVEDFAIGLLKKDFTIGKTVWRGPVLGERPRVDPLGEYFAWTWDELGQKKIALKHVSQSSTVTPTFIVAPFRHAYFCDWAENGDLLANASIDNDHWFLVIFDRKGRLVRKLATSAEPGRGVVASWRKYGHR